MTAPTAPIQAPAGFEIWPKDKPTNIRCLACGHSAWLNTADRMFGGFRAWASEHDCARSAAARREAR